MKQQAVLILDDGWIDSDRNSYEIITVQFSEILSIIYTDDNNISIVLKSGDTFIKENTNKRDYMQLVSSWNKYLIEHNNNNN